VFRLVVNAYPFVGASICVCRWMSFCFEPKNHQQLYVIWVFAISVSLILIYAFVFELLLSKSSARKSFLLLKLRRNPDEKPETLPTYVRSLNMNGLTHFIVSNLLTGLVKFLLNPAKRNGVECVLIVSAYMFINALVVFTMLKYQIRMSKLVKS